MIASRISSAIQGKRLADMRIARNLSQDYVATQMGLSRPTYIAIEKGTRIVKPEEILLLAKILERSVHDIVGQQSVITDFVPQFRINESSNIEESRIQEAIETFRLLCEDYLTLEKIMSSPMPDFLIYDYENTIKDIPLSLAAEQVSQSERQRLGLGDGPIVDLSAVMEDSLGMRVFFVPLSEFKIAGMFYYTHQLGGCVLVNGTHPSTRQRWTLAHELAHFLADRFRQEVTVLAEYGRKPRYEQFADQFAAAFLMPAVSLRPRFFQIRQSKGDFTISELCLLASQYQVSPEAMVRRLEALECLPRGTSNRLAGQSLNRVQQSLNIKTPPGQKLVLPKRFVLLAVQAYLQASISEERLARYLRCSRVEAREIVENTINQNVVDDNGVLYRTEFDLDEVILPGSKSRQREEVIV